MSDDTVVSFSPPVLEDPLSELLQSGACKLIAAAVESELEAFLAHYDDERDAQSRRVAVRNGYQPERAVLTGVGPVNVRIPKSRDRSGQGVGFRSTLVPPYLKKTRRIVRSIESDPIGRTDSKGSTAGNAADDPHAGHSGRLARRLGYPPCRRQPSQVVAATYWVGAVTKIRSTLDQPAKTVKKMHSMLASHAQPANMWGYLRVRPLLFGTRVIWISASE